MLAIVRKITDAMMDFAPNHVRPAEKSPVPHLSRHALQQRQAALQNARGRVVVAQGLEKTSGAGYYFHVSAKEVIIAAGAYMPEKEQLAAIRHWLLDHHAQFRKLLKSQRSGRHSSNLKATRSRVRPRAFPPSIRRWT